MALPPDDTPMNQVRAADAVCDITDTPCLESKNLDQGEPLEQSKNVCGEPETSPWSKCLQLAQLSDKEMIKYWNDEIDGLLLLAALFSAVVASFVVDSYKSLQPDPNQNVAQILAQISLQLSSVTVQAGFLNSTHPPYTPPPSYSSSSSPGSVRTNVLWVSSLILSLTAALYGIFARQWLREFVRRCADGPNSSTHESLCTRQFYYDGLIRWRIPAFMTFLPLLLQATIVLFLAGLVDVLWELDSTVAKFATAMAVSAVLGAIILAAAPAFSTSCPYISPLFSLVTNLVQAMVWVMFFPVGCVLFLRALCHSPPRSGNQWFRCLMTNARTAIERLTQPGRHMILPGLQPSSRHRLPTPELDYSAFAWFYRHGPSTASPPSNTELLECFAKLLPLYQAETIRNIIAMEYNESAKTLLKYAEDRAIVETGGFRFTALPPRPPPSSVCALLLDMVKLAKARAVHVVPPAEGTLARLDADTDLSSKAHKTVSDRLLINMKQYLEPGVVKSETKPACPESTSVADFEFPSMSWHTHSDRRSLPAVDLPVELVTLPETDNIFEDDSHVPICEMEDITPT